MKIFAIIFSIISLGLIGFNATQINSAAPFDGQSGIALITIFAALCGIMLVWILTISKHIQKLSKFK